MTFEEWFSRHGGDDDDWPYPEQLEERYQDSNLTPDGVKSLMQEAWDGRFHTLTYHDI